MKNPYHFDDDEEIEDGHSVRVPMMIMDGNRVNLIDTVRFEDGQPHFLRTADAASESSNFEDSDASKSPLASPATSMKVFGVMGIASAALKPR